MVLIGLQPDYGTALVFVPFTLAVVFAAGLTWRWILLGVAAAAVVLPLAYPRLADHQKDRIKVFLEPPADGAIALLSPLVSDDRQEGLVEAKEHFFKRSESAVDTDWNAHQSLLAVGSGGMWGKGFMRGTQHVLGFLPRTVAPTDFIFSVIAEEAGFAGAGAVLCAFMGLILCMLRTATLACDEFGTYLACGVAVLFFTHVFINVGMTMQAAPIIGIPLPFVSYGGSFMLGTMVCAGLAQSVHVRRGLESE
jgi:rod shape determining protein RodA